MNKALRQATILALLTAVVSGFSIFLNKFAVTTVKDPVFFTTIKNSLVAILLVGLVIAFGKWREIKNLNKSQALKLLLIGVVGGSVPFALFFTGLSQTPAVNAGIIQKTLFIWVALLAIPFLKERMNKWQWLGIATIFAANLFVGGFNGFKYNGGELMIFTATILWAIENVVAKKVLSSVSSLTVGAARMSIGSLILLPIALYRGASFQSLASFTSSQWLWTILPVVLLFIYVLTWYSALKRAPVTYVATLLVPATLITNILSAIFITHTLNTNLIISSILFVGGGALVITFAKSMSIKQEGLKNLHVNP
jgi:drug/metabolite transporter (DMT)-like permease